MRRHIEARPRLEVVEAKLDVGIVQRNVRAALDVGRTAVRIVNRLAIHGDAHHVQLVWAFRTKLLSDMFDIHSFVIVQQQRFVVHHLNAQERLHHVVGLNESTPFVLGPRTGERRIFHDHVHGPACSSRGKADVVVIYGSGATIELLVFRITDKSQSRVFPIRDVGQCAMKVRCKVRRDGLVQIEACMYSRHDFEVVAGADLRRFWQFLEGIVVPELDFNAATQRVGYAASVAFDRGGRQAQGCLHRKCHALRLCLRQRHVVSVGARVAAGQRRVVGVADEADRYAVPVSQIVERCPNLAGERLGN